MNVWKSTLEGEERHFVCLIINKSKIPSHALGLDAGKLKFKSMLCYQVH